MFVAASLLVFVGRKKGWLDRVEYGLAAILLAIPFITRGPDNGWAGQARFVSWICAVFLCSGAALGGTNRYLKAIILAAMAVYSLVFAIEMLCEINVI